MKVKTTYLGTIEADELTLTRLAGVIEDAAAYNLEKHYIKVHGDLIQEANLIREMLKDGQKPHRRISAASQSERSKGAAKTAKGKKQTGVYKESDKK